MIDKTNGIKGGKGGIIYPPKKGDTRGRLGGRPRIPNTIKKMREFFEDIQNQGDAKIKLPASQVVFLEQENKYEILLTKRELLYAVFFKQMSKGDAKFWDMAFRKGFDGGYEPIKTETKLDNVNPTQINIEVKGSKSSLDVD